MIEFNDGLEILAPRPADSRNEVLDYLDLNNLEYVFYGLNVFVINENRSYRCTTIDGIRPISLPQTRTIPISNRKWTVTNEGTGSGVTIIVRDILADPNEPRINKLLDIDLLDDTVIDITITLKSESDNNIFYTGKILAHIIVDSNPNNSSINYNNYGEIYPGQTDITLSKHFINPEFSFSYLNNGRNNIIMNLTNLPDSNIFEHGRVEDIVAKINLNEI